MKGLELYPHVFEPIKAGRLVLKNRIQFSPLVCNMVTCNGEVTQDFIDFIDMQASTGAGLVTIGATPVDLETGIDYASELDVTNDNKICGLIRLAEAAHIHGAKLSIELMHAGRGADPDLLKKREAISSSVFPLPDRPRFVKEMDQEDIDHIIFQYTDVAKRLKKCQFDMVMIHAAHGNLLAQFLSPLTNTRHDNYGGCFENRCRLPLEVLAAVRDAVGDDMAIEMRVSGDEIVEGGMRIEEVIEFIKKAQKYIDLVHISAGLIIDQAAQFNTMPPYYKPHCINVKYAKAVKECSDINIPVTTVGGIVTLDMAEKILAEGSADVVAMARALLADPEMLKKCYRGEPEKVRPCLRCWGCAETYGSHIRCAVNPALGRPGDYKCVMPAFKKKKVVVIGGGPAGMTAVRTLRERGHEVVLFEKRDRLGGMMNDISGLPFKEDMRRHLKWAVDITMQCGADIRLNTEADPKNILNEKPDALFVAVGAVPAIPPIPGIENEFVYDVLEVDNHQVQTGQRVVVCGGGVSGMECALALAIEGKKVTVVDMIPETEFAKGLSGITRSMLFYLLEQEKVELLGDRKVLAITKEGVETEDREWRHYILPADTVVTAFGCGIDQNLVDRLSALVPETYIVGDCSEVKNIKAANNAAYCLAVRV